MMFRDVIGHDQLKKQLIANVKNNRISHAQLFLGHQGSGTLPVALAYARYIQCKNRGADDACGTCPSCLKINKYEHPDLHFIFPTAPNKDTKDKEKVSSKMFLAQWRRQLMDSPYFNYLDWLGSLGIENKQAIINAEDCNDIIRTLGLKSYESPFKIVIIYMIDKLYYSAAPKLLKIVEEPPDNTLFLMISDNKDRIINTILSRTQILKFPLPDEELVKDALVEKYGLDATQAGQIAFLSDGVITDALKMAAHDGAHLADFDSFREWMRFCYTNDTGKILKWVEKTSQAGRERQKSFLQYGLKTFRLCLLNNYAAGRLIRIKGEEGDFLARFSPFINPVNASSVVDAFETAILHLERNANPRILFADLSFGLHRLMHMKPE
ncbi:MAG: DNA polymerase III subunit delta [Bacteroidales bacterium]|nr:DNA polymerase III subunit delta [Bacteroidales bacterium]